MKKLFSTTKRAVLSIIGIVVLAIVAAALLGGLVLSRSLIGKERAGEIALADAGLTEEEVSAFRVKLDYDDGRFCYEIDFYHDGAEYEYAIQAKDGDIFARDIEEGGRRPANSQTASGDTKDPAPEVTTPPQATTTPETTPEITTTPETTPEITTTPELTPEVTTTPETPPQATTKPQYITVEEAKAAALADAGLTAAEVTFTEAKLDTDDGIRVYDISFYTAKAEYDYEIKALDGTVHEKEIESFKNPSPTPTENRNYIGVDRAKELALLQAGLTAADVRFTKAKLENDDGVLEYEIEFYHGRTEYEYEIDAITGEILQWDIDWD